jgi:hypothetical protein
MKATAGSRATILQQQQSWARATGKTSDAQGYLEDVDLNLWRPMCERSRNAFQNGSGGELEKKMRALHSSSALAVNFFEYWVDADRGPLEEALGFDDRIQSITFEAQHHTGLEGNPPNLDVCISLASGHTVAIESKFCEWLTRKSPAKEHFKPKYFPNGSGLWAARQLPQCQALAEDLRRKREHFSYLDAPQLLKHSLGLATQLGQRFDLLYLYYAWPGPESAKHQREVAHFSDRVGKEVRFKAVTYQHLFRQLQSKAVEQSYLAYLRERYFTNAA